VAQWMWPGNEAVPMRELTHEDYQPQNGIKTVLVDLCVICVVAMAPYPAAH